MARRLINNQILGVSAFVSCTNEGQLFTRGISDLVMKSFGENTELNLKHVISITVLVLKPSIIWVIDGLEHKMSKITK